MCLYSLQLVKFNYGMENKNPIDDVRFYKKNSPDKAIKIDENEVGVNVITSKLFTN